MLRDKERCEEMVLALFHAMAQLRNEVNKFVKVLEMEMKKAKEQLLTLEEKK